MIEAINSTSRLLDDLLNIDKEYFEQMVDTIYRQKTTKINKTYTPYTKPSLLDINLSLSYNKISTKIYDKHPIFQRHESVRNWRIS